MMKEPRINSAWKACFLMLILTHLMAILGTAIIVYSLMEGHPLSWSTSFLTFFLGAPGMVAGSISALRLAKEVGRSIQSSDPLSD